MVFLSSYISGEGVSVESTVQKTSYFFEKGATADFGIGYIVRIEYE